MLNTNNWIYFKGRVNILIKWQSPMIFHSRHPLSYYFKNTCIAYFPGKRVVIDLIPVYVCARLLENRLHEQIIKSSFFTFFPNDGLYCNILLISQQYNIILYCNILLNALKLLPNVLYKFQSLRSVLRSIR